MSRIKKKWFRKKNTYTWKYLLAVMVVILCVLGGFALLGKKEKIQVSINVENYEIYQDDTMPAINVQVSSETDNEEVLQWIEHIRAGSGYQIQTDANLSKEGEYIIQFQWDEENALLLSEKWKDRVECKVEAGKLIVKNKYGEWEGDKFKKRDNTYATDEFIVSNGKEYYFDSEGKKVTGEYVIKGITCYFSNEGVYDTEKNKLHPGKPIVALTFDDGPGLYTEELLGFFQENDIRATFFVLGEQVEKYPDVIRLMDETGCQIGNHTYSHERLTELSEEDMLIQINKTNEVLKSILGKGTQIVRPTYGSVNSSVRETVNYPLIMWSFDTEDWKLKDSKKIAEVILKNVKDGDVLLMHDIHDFTVEAMKLVLPILKEQGYQFVTIDELAAFKGTSMEKGTKYFEF